MGEPKFSVVLIARNEIKTLPRLVESLAEFKRRGGEIIVLDTGSTDGTPETATALGCKVTCVGPKFRVTLVTAMAEAINGAFIVDNEKPLVKAGDSFFDFASARNFAAALAKNDMVAMPDCDEIYTTLDIDTVDALIKGGATHLEYPFVFSHDAEGRPDIQFTHCKFYDRRLLEWRGCVHEVLCGLKGATPKCQRLNASIIKLEHWQNPEQSRGQYMTGLAYDCFMNQDKDRNSHYLARELHWTDRRRSGQKEFRRHIAMNGWAPERAQSYVFIGEAHEHFGEVNEAIHAYQEAINVDATRREPLMKLASLYFRKNDPAHTAIYASAALSVDNRGYYMERAHYYREDVHMLLYWSLFYLAKIDEARAHWWKALAFAPDSSRILGDACYYLDLPKVSIVIPTLNRPEKLANLQRLIKERANYPNVEVVVMQDDIEAPRGVVAMVNEGVDKATGEFVMFLSDDCEPQMNFLIQAMLVALENPDHLIALNDGLWKGKLATHWLARRSVREHLPTGNFFHKHFKHHGCDNLLTALFKSKNRLSYAERALINHNHTHDECSALAYKHDDYDRATLRDLLSAYALIDPV